MINIPLKLKIFEYNYKLDLFLILFPVSISLYCGFFIIKDRSIVYIKYKYFLKCIMKDTFDFSIQISSVET